MKAVHLFELLRLCRNPWKSGEKLEALRFGKLKKLLRYAYLHVPYYRRLFDSVGLKPEDIRNPEDFRLLPTTSKETLMSLPLGEKTSEEIDLRRCKAIITSGTSGVPLKISYRPGDWTFMNLGLIRAYLSFGIKPWWKIMSFTGKENPEKKRAWYEHFGIWRGKDASSWSAPSVWLETLQAWKPRALVGYVMTLKLLAEHLRDRGVRDVSPRVVVSGSGILDDFTRRLLASTFQAEVFDLYGTFEAGCIAWECKTCSGYHLNMDTAYVEILTGDQPSRAGEEGDVVVTNLYSYAMPIIRYRQEDIVVLSEKPPACGRNLPLLRSIQGRADDVIRLPDGRRIPSQPFYYSIESVPGIRRWKIVQEALDRIRIEIVPGPSFGPHSPGDIERNMRKFLSREVAVEFRLVDSFPRDPSRKFRQVISKVSSPRSFSPGKE
ncbi:MAG: phenylacetate--CoA ligase family protein [Candidatus Aminicenantes bacterium]|nr:phenylacetate--CoA ligase family protein [Candidatus Aminicenantes bacterium]